MCTKRSLVTRFLDIIPPKKKSTEDSVGQLRSSEFHAHLREAALQLFRHHLLELAHGHHLHPAFQQVDHLHRALHMLKGETSQTNYNLGW